MRSSSRFRGLGANSSKAAAHGKLKRRIAAEYRFDNMGYLHSNDALVKTTLLEARRWYELEEGNSASISLKARLVISDRNRS